MLLMPPIKLINYVYSALQKESSLAHHELISAKSIFSLGIVLLMPRQYKLRNPICHLMTWKGFSSLSLRCAFATKGAGPTIACDFRQLLGGVHAGEPPALPWDEGRP